VRAKQYQDDVCKTHSQCTLISQTELQDRKASNKHDRIGNSNFGQSMFPAASQGADTQQSSCPKSFPPVARLQTV
jgi:hypothetical protein